MVCAGCVGRRGVQGDVLLGVADKQQATSTSRLMQIAVFRVLCIYSCDVSIITCVKYWGIYYLYIFIWLPSKVKYDNAVTSYCWTRTSVTTLDEDFPVWTLQHVC